MAKSKPVGRPSKYSKAMLNKAYKYIDGGYLKTKHGEVVPLMAGLAIHLDVNKSTLYEWVKDGARPEFSDALSKLHDFQELSIVNKSITGEFNSQISKLILSNHGYSEKVQAREEDEPQSLNITFEVKDKVNDIQVTNAKS